MSPEQLYEKNLFQIMTDHIDTSKISQDLMDSLATGEDPVLADIYQKNALRTFVTSAASFSETQTAILNAALGLSGESGEVLDHVKKILFHGHPINREKIMEELGDVCWYIAVMAHVLDINLSEVMVNNVIKLQKRYPQGFSSDKSIGRDAAIIGYSNDSR